MPYLTLSILENPFTIHRLTGEDSLPPAVEASQYLLLSRTTNDISIAVPAGIHVQSEQNDPNWVCIQVVNSTETGQPGTLTHIATQLSNQNISTIITSTFKGDYFLIKIDHLVAAKKILERTRCRFLRASKKQPNPDIVERQSIEPSPMGP